MRVQNITQTIEIKLTQLLTNEAQTISTQHIEKG